MDEPQSTGIYSECPICWAVVANAKAHEAWHGSRGEGMNDANDEPA